LNIYYHPEFNFNLGLLNKLHPFEGRKFTKIHREIERLSGVVFKQPDKPVSPEVVENFVNDLLKRLIKGKRYVLEALELPYIPLLPFSYIEKKILLPMRWGVAATMVATKDSLSGNNCWNLSGGYHHASPKSAEGFCIYNDIGITYNELLRLGQLDSQDRILIIDVDAHHGNGNATTFQLNKNVTLLDIYNNDIYPQNSFTKKRVDINVPLPANTSGEHYLHALEKALHKLDSHYRIAYVIAGTDVLATDKLGGLKLSVEQCADRDELIFNKLSSISVPAIFLGGGGYSRDSATAVTTSIKRLYSR